MSAWLGAQRCRKALLIGGNHELLLEAMGPAGCKKAFPGYMPLDSFRFWRWLFARGAMNPYSRKKATRHEEGLGMTA